MYSMFDDSKSKYLSSMLERFRLPVKPPSLHDPVYYDVLINPPLTNHEFTLQEVIELMDEIYRGYVCPEVPVISVYCYAVKKLLNFTSEETFLIKEELSEKYCN